MTFLKKIAPFVCLVACISFGYQYYKLIKTNLSKKKVISETVHRKTASHSKKKRPKRNRKKLPSKLTSHKEVTQIKNHNLKKMILIYGSMAKFPKTSMPIKKAKKTALELRYKVKKQITTSAQSSDLQVRSWPSRNYNYLPKEYVTLSLQLLEKNKLIKAKIWAKLYDENQNFIKNISFTNNGHNTYKRSLKHLKEGKYLVKYKVSPTNITGPNKNHYVQTIESFAVLHQNITFTGNMKDSLDSNGNLIIDFQVNVRESGDYLLESVCYNKSQIAIGLAERFYSLKKGKQWIKYDYHGYLFSHIGEAGHFFIKHLSLSKVNKNLTIATGKPRAEIYRTNDYDQNEFNQTPFSNQELLKKKEKLVSYLSRSSK